MRSAAISNSGPDAALNLSSVHKTWSVIPVDLFDPISLRAISPKGRTPKLQPINATFTSTDYPSVAARKHAFESEALRLNECGYNVYAVMNAIRSDFCQNQSARAPVRDTDIARRTVLLVDVDRASTADRPASDEELHDAMRVASNAEKYLTALGWPLPIRAFSGNGFHLYWRLDNLQNDSTASQAIKTLLRALAEKFDTPRASIDSCVANASRITKVPGTIARKGVTSVERPFRRAFVINDHVLRPVTREDLTRAISTLQASAPAASRNARKSRLPGVQREPDTPRRRARLLAMLEHISANCSYQRYRDVVWAILSTGWTDAPILAEQWCKTALDCFNQNVFLETVNSYDPTRSNSPTLGTVTFLARQEGCDV